MGKLSETDKHNPIIQTDQVSPEIPKPTLTPPGHHKNEIPVKDAVQRNERDKDEESQRSGTH